MTALQTILDGQPLPKLQNHETVFQKVEDNTRSGERVESMKETGYRTLVETGLQKGLFKKDKSAATLLLDLNDKFTKYVANEAALKENDFLKDKIEELEGKLRASEELNSQLKTELAVESNNCVEKCDKAAEIVRAIADTDPATVLAKIITGKNSEKEIEKLKKLVEKAKEYLK